MEIYTCLVLLFTLSELTLLIAKRSKTNAVKNRDDKSSMLLLWITIPLCLTAAGFISGYKIWMFYNISLAEKAGVILTVAGFIIRWTAIAQLGKMFTVDVAISNTHILKTSGLYKIVRHPSYLGLVLIIAGLVLYMGSILSFIIVLIPVFLALNYRIAAEEKALTNEFGAQYEAYKKQAARLLPWIY